MTLDRIYWLGLVTDYVTAYVQCFPSAGGGAQGLPGRNTVLLCCAVAEHETNNGRAWPGTNNFGAVQLGPLTAQQYQAWQDGTLHAGDYNADRTGVLHIDTHPTPNGPQPYPVWFVAFPTQVAGIAHFLKVLYRDSDAVADESDCTAVQLAEHMWQHGYYEERYMHLGPVRPVGQRALPLPPEEAARVNDYGGAVQRCYDAISAALGDWDPSPPQNQEPSDAAAGQTALPAA